MIAPLRPDDPRAIGPYRLSGQLGCGGMGRVFLGLSADGLPVAVKVIRAELSADGEFRNRFQQEVAAARKASGVFTARVVDADLDGPVPWLATEYVAGPSLGEAVNTSGPLPVDEVLRLAAGLAEGLIAIHAAGVVHRDLKPSNILLADDGPRVIDFGISWTAWASTTSGWGFGSPRFMSPEHALGQVIGPPSDIFSLGAVLTFAATGQGPFGSGSSAALIYRVVNSPARLDPVPEELRGLVASCLAKHPDDRPTAGHVLTEVGAIQQKPARTAVSENEAEAPELVGVSSAAGLTAGELQPGGAGRDLRRRASRALPLFVPGLLAAGAVAFYLLSGAGASSPATLTQPQAGTAPSAAQGQPQGTGAAAGSGPAPRAGVTVSPAAHKIRAGPAVIQGPPVSAFVSPSAFTSVSPSAFAFVIPAPSSSGSAAPSKSPSPSPSSKSPSPSPSSSKSGSPSPSPSPSTSSSSPSPSPSSSSPSASATSTPSTSPSPSTSPT
jgi:Protein kinase domain